MLLGVIRTPDQRPTLHIVKPFLQAHSFVMGESVGCNEGIYGQVHGSWLKVLADGDDVDAIIQVGTNLSTAAFFPVVEKWLAKPVLTINVATAWHALRSCGIRDQYDHLGRLFEES